MARHGCETMDETGNALARTVRIGGASGFWGDSSVAVPQLLRDPKLDFLVFDYLAELTMAILAAARAKNPALGYAVDFVATIRDALPQLMSSGVRVISNAGGVNPQACADALAAAAAELGFAPKIAIVHGDDAMPLVESLRALDVRDLDTGRPMPAKLLTANAYLGALPIRRALDDGAQIVITGRCVDSAVTLGALMHSFAWRADDHDRLAAGSLAGHIIECGCQATGGLHTDWRDVPDWAGIGYPIVEANADGSFVITKPEGTGGLVTPAVVAEQIVYEIGDPGAYVLADVVCDFTQVRLRSDGADRVAVTGARGRQPTDRYKVCATWHDGYQCAATLMIIGFDAAGKARRTADAILARTRSILQERQLGDYGETLVEVIGTESVYGPHARIEGSREVVLRVAVRHADRRALGIFAAEIGAAGTSWAPGTTGVGGRPKVSSSIRLFSFLLDKKHLAVTLTTAGVDESERIPVEIPTGAPGEASAAAAVSAVSAASARTPDERSGRADAAVEPEGETVEVPLIELAYARSGDKGDQANIGVIARKPEYYPLLVRWLTPQRVGAYLAHLVRGEVHRYELPGMHAMNFVCEQALAGGVAASLRYDPWGKGFAQIVLSMPVRVPVGCSTGDRSN